MKAEKSAKAPHGDTFEKRLCFLRATLMLAGKSRSLLERAEKDEVRIIFDATLPETTLGHYNRTDGRCSIALNPAYGDNMLVSTLIHELRHHWQQKTFGIGKIDGLLPYDRLLMLFFLEADARGYAAAATLDINKVSKYAFPLHKEGGLGFAAGIKHAFGLAADKDIYAAVFKSFLRSAHTGHYAAMCENYSYTFTSSCPRMLSISDFFDNLSQAYLFYGRPAFARTANQQHVLRMISQSIKPALRRRIMGTSRDIIKKRLEITRPSGV